MNAPDRPADFEIRIRPNTSWLHFDWQGLKNYRDLLWLLIQRDFTSKYKQTILGPLWFFLNPLITALVFTLVFNRVIGVPTDGVDATLFYITGMLGWAYFSAVLGSTSNSLAGNTHLFSKVYFPRLIPPLAVTLSSLFSLGIQLLTFFGIYARHLLTVETTPIASPSLLWLVFPFVALHMAVLGLGVGLLFSAISAKYRDLQHIQGFVLNLWMYGTPIIYPLSRIPEEWRWLAEINPMTAIVEATRYIFLGVGTVSSTSYATSVAISSALFLLGLFAYQKSARTFVDSV